MNMMYTNVVAGTDTGLQAAALPVMALPVQVRCFKGMPALRDASPLKRAVQMGRKGRWRGAQVLQRCR